MNRRSALVALASALSLAGIAPASAQAFIRYEPASFAQMLASGATLVVHVHADWCPTCRAQEPTLARLVQDPALAEVRFVRVDFDRDRDFLTAHRVANQSTILVFRGGRVVARMIGTTNPEELTAGIRRGIG